MKIEKNMKIGMSLALVTVLSLGVTGCTSDSNDSAPGTDVVVERGKVFGANVTDSSSPAQVATQKSRQNVYTFTNEPVYPVLVNGGWIDVNDDGVMDLNDVKLDIEMRSYTTTVTPVTTFIADANETIRDSKLNDLVARLNANGVGEAGSVTAEDLLKVPSKAPRDVFVVANAIYKDMKENSNALPDENAVLTQFGTIDSSLGADATAKDFEVKVIGDLVTNKNVFAVNNSEIALFNKDILGLVSTLETAILQNNITGIDNIFDNSVFKDDYTVDVIFQPGGTPNVYNWSVVGNVLTVEMMDGDKEVFTFDSQTPTNGSSVTHVGYYGDTMQDYGSTTIALTTPTVVTPDASTNTSVNLSGYSSIIIYKNISQPIADSLLSGFSNNSGFKSENTTASCTDFGFTNPTVTANVKVYTIIDGLNSRSCSEADYANQVGTSGNANILAYYGN
ncbi:hypothetical protein GJV85_07765 [Sulfurimonas aquatica]|uniref:Lipoprotein n=1 Tax=Sulfurimonas aquatica TaxID=2672570 RepID=A0A975GD57_9BACT|nr:hypothetical protein [Sulfurimonas aquatica]QSZ42008.1 hypothetical protein GJV85_07765 [Sulfurimonas aquatica]